MTPEMLLAFALTITHVPAVDTPFVRLVRKRAEVATAAIYDVTTNGYRYNGQLLKVQPLFTHDGKGKVLTYEEAMEATQKLAASISFHESSNNPKAHRKVDGSNDCGLMQTKPMWISKWLTGYGCEDIKKDPAAAIYVGLETLQFKKKDCTEKLPTEQQKNVTAMYWLGAFASGTCGFAQVKARELCAPAGVCDYR